MGDESFDGILIIGQTGVLCFALQNIQFIYITYSIRPYHVSWLRIELCMCPYRKRYLPFLLVHTFLF